MHAQIAVPTIHTQTELVGRKGQVQPQPRVMEHNDVDTISPVAQNLYQFVPFIFGHQFHSDCLLTVKSQHCGSCSQSEKESRGPKEATSVF